MTRIYGNGGNKNIFFKKILLKVKEHLMSDDIKEEFKKEIMEPFCNEIINFILPHYFVFMILLIIIIILLICIISMTSNIKYKK